MDGAIVVAMEARPTIAKAGRDGFRNQLGIDRRELLERPLQQQIKCRAEQDRDPLARPRVAFPLSAQQAGPENIDPFEPKSRHRRFHLAFRAQVEISRMRVSAHGRHSHEPIGSGSSGRVGESRDQVEIDRSEAGLRACLAPRRPKRGYCGICADRADHSRPITWRRDMLVPRRVRSAARPAKERVDLHAFIFQQSSCQPGADQSGRAGEDDTHRQKPSGRVTGPT